ncbi:NAD(P)/FAD-dependent oxidoreductase [Thalassomonas sp. M1454]|uniref:NAD(P)/FAD-dependent oxidoreductase n=1 Tax=Thalassomonas sp. M1454 TaxID=2594477 RepID=UPI00117E6533|nr:FAD-dependent oxidoreductase [Thalassomonas sp. M1454]TRX57848.1 FAD-dependent oxidoreductase [Thalassomonas sp. M1454]
MQQALEALQHSKYGSLWLDSDDRPESEPALEEDVVCELLVVGGGFTGLWGALQAKERRPDLDIILIEKTFIADGASGRNGGFLSSDLAHGENNTEYHFPGEEEKLAELGKQNIREMLATFDKYGIDVHYECVGETEVAVDDAAKADLRELYEEEKAAGEDVVWYNQEEMQKQVNSPTYKAGMLYRNGLDGIVDPARICWGLKEVLLKLGVRIYEHTPVEMLKPLGQDKMKASCPNGLIIADKVLVGTNAFRSPVRQIRKSIIPVWDYQIATEPLTEEQLKAIGWDKFHHALGENNNMFHYYRMTKDKRITWGGGGAVRYYYNKNIKRRDCADIPERFEQLAAEFFETFPQLKDVKFSHRWSGIIATSTRFCMVPGHAYDKRVAWAVGYTGLGVGASRFGARVALELLGYDPTDILDMQFIKKKPMPWAPEPFRWLGVKITHAALVKADKNNGKRGLWLKLLDKLNLGFTC